MTKQAESNSQHISQNVDERASFLNQSVDEDKQIPPDQLSGDEGIGRTIQMSMGGGLQSKAGVFLSSINVMKTLIGAGIISLPYTISVMGWVLSIILFIFIAVVNQYSCYILMKSKNLSKHSTYNSIAYHLYRHKAFRVSLSGMNLFSNIGFVIAMLTIFKSAARKVLLDFVDPQLKDQFYLTQAFLTIVVALILLPTIFIKKIQRFSKLSLIGIFCISLAMISLTAIFFDEMSDRNWQNSFQMIPFPQDILGMVSVLPNIMLALNFQSCFFSVYKGITKTTDKKGFQVCLLGLTVTTVLYLLVGIMGYCLFGELTGGKVQANFLVMLDKDKINPVLYALIFIGFLISDLLSVPITFFCARNNMIAIIKIFTVTQETYKNIKPEFKDTIQEIGSFVPQTTDDQMDKKKKANLLFIIYSLGLYILCVVITILVSSLQAVFNLVGAIASSSISFIFPFLFYLLLVKRKKKKKNINFYLTAAGLAIFIPLGILSVVSLYI